MKINTRLLRLEKIRPKLVYPGFSDMYSLQTPGAYNQWLLDNNPGTTLAMINELNIFRLDSCYY